MMEQQVAVSFERTATGAAHAPGPEAEPYEFGPFDEVVNIPPHIMHGHPLASEVIRHHTVWAAAHVLRNKAAVQLCVKDDWKLSEANCMHLLAMSAADLRRQDVQPNTDAIRRLLAGIVSDEIARCAPSGACVLACSRMLSMSARVGTARVGTANEYEMPYEVCIRLTVAALDQSDFGDSWRVAILTALAAAAGLLPLSSCAVLGVTTDSLSATFPVATRAAATAACAAVNTKMSDVAAAQSAIAGADAGLIVTSAATISMAAVTEMGWLNLVARVSKSWYTLSCAASLWSSAMRQTPGGLGILVATASHLGNGAMVVAISESAHDSVRSSLDCGDVIESVNGMPAAIAVGSLLRTGGLLCGPVKLTLRINAGVSDRDYVLEGDVAHVTCYDLSVPVDVIAMQNVMTPKTPSAPNAADVSWRLSAGVAQQLTEHVVHPARRRPGDQRRRRWPICFCIYGKSVDASGNPVAFSEDAFGKLRVFQSFESLPGVMEHLYQCGWPTDAVEYSGPFDRIDCCFGCPKGVTHDFITLPTRGHLDVTAIRTLRDKLDLPPLLTRVKSPGHIFVLADAIASALVRETDLGRIVSSATADMQVQHSIGLCLFGDGATVVGDHLLGVGFKLFDRKRDDAVRVFVPGHSLFQQWFKANQPEEKVSTQACKQCCHQRAAPHSAMHASIFCRLTAFCTLHADSALQ